MQFYLDAPNPRDEILIKGKPNVNVTNKEDKGSEMGGELFAKALWNMRGGQCGSRGYGGARRARWQGELKSGSATAC